MKHSTRHEAVRPEPPPSLSELRSARRGPAAQTGTRKRRRPRVARGKYLVTTSGCHDCHTPSKMGPNGPEPDMTRMLSGHPQDLEMPPAPVLPPGPWAVAVAATSTAWSGPWGVSFTANLTPDPETGLGTLDAAQLRRHDPQRPPHGPRPPDPAADADRRCTSTSPTRISRRCSPTCSTIPPINKVPEPLPPAPRRIGTGSPLRRPESIAHASLDPGLRRDDARCGCAKRRARYFVHRSSQREHRLVPQHAVLRLEHPVVLVREVEQLRRDAPALQRGEGGEPWSPPTRKSLPPWTTSIGVFHFPTWSTGLCFS